VRIVRCSYDEHGAAVLGMLNDAILNSTAVYDYRPRTADSMRAWFEVKRQADFPVLGLVADGGRLAGFASYGAFRAWPAYRYSVEHSVHVHKDHRRQGIGLQLLRALIEVAGEQQYHTLIGGIDVANGPSIALHEKLGFRWAGTIQHAGFKFGRWLDLAFYQLLLEGPAQPRES
jgi:L-amino acid N-acyltransferase YncA